MSFKFNHKNSTDWIFQFLLVMGLVLLYFRTMSDFANLEDSGLFISVAHEPGIAHPPGYPLYTMLAHLFTWVLLGSIAERVHALSAIAGISSCILLFQISRELKADSSFFLPIQTTQCIHFCGLHMLGHQLSRGIRRPIL